MEKLHRMKSRNVIMLLVASVMALATVFTATAASFTAAEVVAKSAAGLSGAKSLNVSFTVVSGGHTSKGTLKSSGKKFAVSLPEGNSWYNGKDLYSYNPRTRETTVVTPGVSELAEANPLLYVNSSAKAYNAVFSKNRIKGRYVVDLTPKSRKSSVRKITLTVNASTFVPEKIVVTASSGQTAEVTVTSVKRNTAFSPSEFEYPRKKYPKAEIVDLR